MDILCCAGNFFTNQLCCVSFALTLKTNLFLFDVLMHYSGLQIAACGHLSCFWCVHWSMSGLRVSHCPICRDPYLHFPTICLKLHFLLKKLYPITHNKREAQLLSEFFFALSVTFSMLLGSGVSNFCSFNVLFPEDEQARACFSPQIDEPKAKLQSLSVSGECIYI